MFPDILKEIICPAAQFIFAEGQTQLIVKEADRLSKIKKLTIQGIEAKLNSFAFTLDYSTKPDDRKKPCFKQPSSYLHPENKEGINKGCDLILFTYFKEKWYVLIMDLKSDKPDKGSTEKQLKNSELFVKYIVSLINVFYSNESIPELNYIKSYTITSSNRHRIPKGRTHYHRHNNTKPQNNIFSISVKTNSHQEASVYLAKLLGQ